MFDWNDQELENIIWGEADEGDEHIVPYPDRSEGRSPDLYRDHIKKEQNKEASKVKPAEQQKIVGKSELNGGKLENHSQYKTNEGLTATGSGVDPWPDLSLSNTAKTDQDSMDKTAGLDNGSEILQNQHKDKEESDLVDYGWANIGSFDDLDRIFSNNDLVFGHASLGSGDELWSSSKDVTNSPEKSVSISMDSPRLRLREHFGKADCMLDQDQPLTPGYDEVNDLTCQVPLNIEISMDHLGHAGLKSKLYLKDKIATEMVSKSLPFDSNLDAGSVATSNDFSDKISRQRIFSESPKQSEEKSEAKQLQGARGTWFPSGNQFLQLDSEYIQMGQVSPSPGCSQHMHFQGLGPLLYKNFSTPLLAPSVHVNIGNQYPAIRVLPQSEGNQNVSSGSEVSPGINKLPYTPANALKMTPQEKIEKLRRRQKMRAMLAIQKQQKQFRHQVSSSERSISQKYSNDNQMQLGEGGNLEVDDCLKTIPSLDPNSPIEQDDSNTISMAVDKFSLEDTILYRLQDIIAKLDIQLRLCIRDSLFRLAQSAMQRQYAGDTCSNNKSNRDDVEVFAKEETNSHNRFARMPDVETETNPIDRSVAHLLFHRPLDLSGKLPEMPESPASANLSCERKVASSLSSQRGFWPDEENSKSSSCILTSENTSKCEAGRGDAKESYSL